MSADYSERVVGEDTRKRRSYRSSLTFNRFLCIKYMIQDPDIHTVYFIVIFNDLFALLARSQPAVFSKRCFSFFSHRDNVTWDDEQEREARQKVVENSTVLASADQIAKFDDEADLYWDKFYEIHQNR